MTDSNAGEAADPEEWRTYEEFAAGIDTYRLPSVSLAGERLVVTLDEGGELAFDFGTDTVTWSATGPFEVPAGTVDAVDVVAVRENVWFIDVAPPVERREKLTVLVDGATNRAIAVRSVIAAEAVPGETQVTQEFFAATTDRGPASGEAPGPSRELIGHRNLYRYSPEHLYEHVYVSSQRYAWQCLQGVQRGHGDMDLSTVWRLGDGLVLFCFREFRIPVASVWLHDFGQLRTTGVFLGLTAEGVAEHSKAGGNIIQLGAVVYPDVQPV